MKITNFKGKDFNTKRIIYTPSSFAKENLIYLQEAGQLNTNGSHTSQRNHLNSYLFFLVTNGNGCIKYDGKQYNLKAGDCVFIDCNKNYSHSTSKDFWSLKWIHFYGNNLISIYNKYIERGGKIIINLKQISQYENIIDEIFSIANSSENIKDMKIYEQLVCLLTLLMQESCNHDNKKNKDKANQNIYDIKNYLDDNFTSKITLDSLSEKFFINKFYLSRLFKSTFGISIINYILKLRITNAKELLRFSTLSIEQISYKCGIDDPNYFSRIFKNIEGCTPNEYRKNW